MNKNNEFTISYAITACNEHFELSELFKQLKDHVRECDEVVIQTDLGNTTEQVYSTISEYQPKFNCKFLHIEAELNKDFASFKNHLKSACEKDYVFQIDADELLGDGLLKHLPLFLEENPDIDVFFLPRINIVVELTEQYAKDSAWRVDRIGFPIAKDYDYQVVNYPDSQGRLMRNLKSIYWKNRVHERLTGYREYFDLGKMEVTDDFKIEDVQNWCLIHIKAFERQQQQNMFYKSLANSEELFNVIVNNQ